MLRDAETTGQAIADIATLYTNGERRVIRAGEASSAETIDKTVRTVMTIAVRMFGEHPNVRRIPSYADLRNTYILRAALCYFLLVLDWTARGGFQRASPAKLRNDFVDMLIAAYGTYFDGLMNECGSEDSTNSYGGPPLAYGAIRLPGTEWIWTLAGIRLFDETATSVTEAVNRCLHGAKLVSTWISLRTDGLSVLTDQRRLLSAARVHQAMEHQDGIIHLVDTRLYGSAMTLVRPLFEAYVRGVWLYHCATDDQIVRMGKQGTELDVTQMIPQLERTEALGGGVLVGILRQSGSAMNRFTHTNWLQIIRRMSETALEPNYEPDEIVAALEFATAIALLSTCHIAILRNDDNLAAECLAKIKDVAANR